jgi:hypothetical protein
MITSSLFDFFRSDLHRRSVQSATLVSGKKQGIHFLCECMLKPVIYSLVELEYGVPLRMRYLYVRALAFDRDMV